MVILEEKSWRLGPVHRRPLGREEKVDLLVQVVPHLDWEGNLRRMVTERRYVDGDTGNIYQAEIDNPPRFGKKDPLIPTPSPLDPRKGELSTSPYPIVQEGLKSIIGSSQCVYSYYGTQKDWEWEQRLEGVSFDPKPYSLIKERFREILSTWEWNRRLKGIHTDPASSK